MKKAKPDSFDRFFGYSWIVVFLVPFLLYLSSLSLGFVYFDDDVLVLENQAQLSNTANIGKLFTTDVFIGHSVPYYRPMLNVALMIGAQMGGTDPKVYHLVSLLIHCLTCVSLLWLLSLLGFSRQQSLVGALLFSLHPLIANAVFWIPALNDLLITLFGVLSFATFIKFTRDRSWLFFFLHLLFFATAFFSKESAAALPILFLLYLVMNRQRVFEPFKIVLFISWIPIILLWFFLRQSSIGELQDDEQGLAAILKNLPFLPEIIAQFFLPFNLAVMPVFSAFYTIAGIMFILLIAAAIIFFKQKNTPMLILGAAWFLAFAVPNMFIRLFNAGDSFDYLPHRACMPAIGLLIMVLALIPEAWIDIRKRAVQISLVGLVSMLAVLSMVQQSKYKDGEAYWQSVLKVSPDRAWFHHFYGRYYFKQQDFAKFELQLQEALRLKAYGTFYYNLGMIELVQKKNYDMAYSSFTKAIELGETNPEVIKNFIDLCNESAVALSKKGDYAKAAERAEVALKYDPASVETLMNLAFFYINLGKTQQAVALWRRVLKTDPAMISASKNLCIYYTNSTNLEDSAGYFATQFVKFGGKAAELPSKSSGQADRRTGGRR